MPKAPSFTEEQVREAVAISSSYSEVLRRVGLRAAGGNTKTIRRYVDVVWRIPTDHFDPYANHTRGRRPQRPLSSIMVRGSVYHRAALKRRLFDEGLKRPICELCGQGEVWHGRRMALILDHVNGEATDNRLENLRIVCPNCNATLETHCGRNKRRGRPSQECAHCRGTFRPTHAEQRFCPRSCGARFNAPTRRRVDRPNMDELLVGIRAEGYEGLARTLGVSGNAIRKWLRLEGVTPPPGPGRALHPPPVRRMLGEIKAREALKLSADGLSDRAVAERLGVSRWCIRDLRRRRSYRHVERPGGLAA